MKPAEIKHGRYYQSADDEIGYVIGVHEQTVTWVEWPLDGDVSYAHLQSFARWAEREVVPVWTPALPTTRDEAAADAR